MTNVQYFLKMQLISFIMGFFFFLVAGNAYAKSCGSLTGEEREIPIKSTFHSLSIAGDAEVFITQGETLSLRLEGSKKLLDDLDISFSGGTLEIEPDDCDSGEYKVHVTMKEIQDFRFSGDVDVHGQNELQGGKIEIKASGHVDLELVLSVEALEVSMSGDVDMKVAGNSQKVTVESSGNGDFIADDLESQDYIVEGSGNTKFKIHAKKSLQVNVSGNGKVNYKGTPKIDASTSGNAKIQSID